MGTVDSPAAETALEEEGALKPADFIATARDLGDSNLRGRPRETDLRRAVSTTYYALFHCVAETGADLLVGGAGADRSRPAWRQVYRALDHGVARQRCEKRNFITRFPDEIQHFASIFCRMQTNRHAADYDPDASFVKSEVLDMISDAEIAINGFQNSPSKDRCAFAVYVLLNLRSEAAVGASPPRRG